MEVPGGEKLDEGFDRGYNESGDNVPNITHVL